MNQTRKEELAKKRKQPVMCLLCKKLLTRGNIVPHENSQKHIKLFNIKRKLIENL